MLHLKCPSVCYRRFVILLAVPPHSSRQLLCPSRHFVHYFLRSATLHPVRSYSFASGRASHQPGTNHNTWECTSLSQANATILTGFHSATLRHSFTSVAFSPPAANYFARRLSPLRLRSPCVANCLCRTSISQSIAKVLLHSSAASVPCGKFTPAASYVASIVAATWLSFFSLIRKVAATLLLAPSWGSQALPFVSLSSALWRLATSATVRTSLPHSYVSFLPQALLPAG